MVLNLASSKYLVMFKLLTLISFNYTWNGKNKFYAKKWKKYGMLVHYFLIYLIFGQVGTSRCVVIFYCESATLTSCGSGSGSEWPLSLIILRISFFSTFLMWILILHMTSLLSILNVVILIHNSKCCQCFSILSLYVCVCLSFNPLNSLLV